MVAIKKVFITGRPGVGKTTLFMKVIHYLRSEGLSIGGFICPEVRVRGKRIGFKIIDIADGKEGFLARVCNPALRSMEHVPKVGKYCVNVDDAVSIGVNAVNKAVFSSSVVGIDEIGPMELSVKALREAIYEALSSLKPLIAVVHRSRVREIIRRVPNASLYTVTLSNRNSLFHEVVNDLSS